MPTLLEALPVGAEGGLTVGFVEFTIEEEAPALDIPVPEDVAGVVTSVRCGTGREGTSRAPIASMTEAGSWTSL